MEYRKKPITEETSGKECETIRIDSAVSDQGNRGTLITLIDFDKKPVGHVILDEEAALGFSSLLVKVVNIKEPYEH